MIAVLLAVAVSQGAVPTSAQPSAVQVANERRLAATPSLLAQYFDPPRRVRFEPWVSSYGQAISADCTMLYFIGDNDAGIHLLRRSLATGDVTIGPTVQVHGDLYTLPNELDHMAVAWQVGGASGPFGVGIIDLRDGIIEPLTVRSDRRPQEGLPKPGRGPGSALPGLIDDADTFSNGEVLVAPSGRFLAVGHTPPSGDCYLPEFMVFNTASNSLEYRFVPTKAGAQQSQGHGESGKAMSVGCDDTWEAFWHEGDILRIFRLRSSGYKAMFEVSHNNGGEWRSSPEKPIGRVPETRPSQSLGPRDRRLVLAKGADGPSFEIDPAALFPREQAGLSVVYGPCCVVILHPLPRDATQQRGVEAVILRWKNQATPIQNQ